MYSNYNYEFTIHLLYMYTNYTIPSLLKTAKRSKFLNKNLNIGLIYQYLKLKIHSKVGFLSLKRMLKNFINNS